MNDLIESICNIIIKEHTYIRICVENRYDVGHPELSWKFLETFYPDYNDDNINIIVIDNEVWIKNYIKKHKIKLKNFIKRNEIDENDLIKLILENI